jgi:hypothetical protein
LDNTDPQLSDEADRANQMILPRQPPPKTFIGYHILNALPTVAVIRRRDKLFLRIKVQPCT